MMLIEVGAQEKKMPIVRGEGPFGVCINPSRELARQTYDVVQEHTDALGFSGYPQMPESLALRPELEIFQ